METNNRDFVRLNYVFLLSIIALISCYVSLQGNIVVYLIFGIIICCLYVFIYTTIKNMYMDLRKLMSFVEQDIAFVKDGDFGLLYDKIMSLKKENQRYQDMIQDEKQKLKRNIDDICHQMKTPLASLFIYNEILSDKYEDQELKDSIQQIEKMNYLFNSLLRLSKIESIELDFVELPIEYVLELSLQSLHTLIENKNIEIKKEYVDTSVYYDESWLQEALSNIIKNQLEQECSTITIRLEDYKEYVKVYISNDGPEICQDDLPHIFERFYRAKNSKSQGIGI